MPLIAKEVRELSCVMTAEELAEASTLLAVKTMELGELEERKKSVAAEFKGKMDVMSAGNTVLARKINSRSELRQVECRWEYDWESGKKTLYRTDTGEQVSQDFIKEHEMQTHFEDLKKEPPVVDGEPVENEQPKASEPAQLPGPQRLIEGEFQDVTGQA